MYKPNRYWIGFFFNSRRIFRQAKKYFFIDLHPIKCSILLKCKSINGDQYKVIGWNLFRLYNREVFESVTNRRISMEVEKVVRISSPFKNLTSHRLNWFLSELFLSYIAAPTYIWTNPSIYWQRVLQLFNNWINGLGQYYPMKII